MSFLLPTTTENIDSHIGIYESDDQPSALSTYLAEIKEEIGKHNDLWDSCKAATNSYEYIHTSIPGKTYSVAKYKPLSRSYFKMVEMIQDFNLLQQNGPFRSFHMAEGPGGFIEAVAHCRHGENAKKKKTPFSRWQVLDEVVATTKEKDQYIGMTLQNEMDHRIPGWRKTASSFRYFENTLYLENGVDHTGNLLHYCNYEYCKIKYGGKMGLITADGGFDFSADYNDQESMMIPLLFAQIVFALAMQKQSGHFVLKVFDCFHPATIDLLFWLSSFYEKVYIHKPFTSRMANSEKYIICQNMWRQPSSESMDQIQKTFCDILQKRTQPYRLLNCPLPQFFLQRLHEINGSFGQLQLENIHCTLNHIKQRKIECAKSRKLMENVMRQNIKKCVDWCTVYHVPFHSQFYSDQSRVPFYRAGMSSSYPLNKDLR